MFGENRYLSNIKITLDVYKPVTRYSIEIIQVL